MRIIPTLPKSSSAHLAHFYLEIQAMDYTNNSSGATSNAAPAKSFPESNMGRHLMKVLLDQGSNHRLPPGEDQPDQGCEVPGGPHRSPRRPAVAAAWPRWRDHSLRGWGPRPPGPAAPSGKFGGALCVSKIEKWIFSRNPVCPESPVQSLTSSPAPWTPRVGAASRLSRCLTQHGSNAPG